MNKDEKTQAEQLKKTETTPKVDNIDELQNQKIAEQDAKIAELTADLQRTRADFENFRRQNELQREQNANSVRFSTVAKFLPLIDDFERAISANPKELSPLAKNLDKTLGSLGLTKLNSEVGATFDPDLHNAISSEGDGEKELISESLQSGFYYNGEVLRPALVRIKKQ